MAKYKCVWGVGPLGFFENNVDTGEGSESKERRSDGDCGHGYT